jgi:predicted metal-binding membrane protein
MHDALLSPWSAAYLLPTLLMWSAMMAAMMLPSAVPMLRLVALSAANTTNGERSATPLFGAGYLAVWTVFSAFATVLQAQLYSAALLSPELAVTDPYVRAVVLTGAGVYELTRWKHACLTHCQNPFGFIMQYWREGAAGAVEMGVRHGAWCVGCCWSLMLVLFAVGVMDLVWVAGLASVVLLERVVIRRDWFRHVIAAALFAGAVAQLV